MASRPERALGCSCHSKKKVDWSSPLLSLSLGAMFAFSESTGFRRARVALHSGCDFDDHRLHRSSLRWEIDGTLHADPSLELLRALVRGWNKRSSNRRAPRRTTMELFGVSIPSGWPSTTPTLAMQRGGFCASSYSFRCSTPPWTATSSTFCAQQTSQRRASARKVSTPSESASGTISGEHRKFRFISLNLTTSC